MFRNSLYLCPLVRVECRYSLLVAAFCWKLQYLPSMQLQTYIYAYMYIEELCPF